MKILDNGFAFLIVMVLSASIIGCDREEWKKEHPEEEQVLEDVVHVIETVAEKEIEGMLGVPAVVVEPVVALLDKEILD
ncbi:MAG: hypothetical protein ABIP54_02275 [Candidatus Andersenbacteria bacterium]